MQENLNTPPFSVGQKVVALINGFTFKKGDIREVEKVEKGCCCWLVSVGDVTPITVTLICKCGSGAELRLIAGNPCSSDACCFAPIQTQYTDITKELADSVKETVEAPDKILIPQTVKN